MRLSKSAVDSTVAFGMTFSVGLAQKHVRDVSRVVLSRSLGATFCLANVAPNKLAGHVANLPHVDERNLHVHFSRMLDVVHFLRPNALVNRPAATTARQETTAPNGGSG